ncbi:MAG: twin-arginine translocase TatA/TatE family subunit [Bacteroidales bacterium]|nr:twin-arginine translocase TatA/TatE family subunit [Bacteroidales bacterium]
MLAYPLLFSVGPWEVILIVLVIILLFGGKKIPELMRGLGKGVKSFKAGMKDVEGDLNEIKKDINESDSKKSE